MDTTELTNIINEFNKVNISEEDNFDGKPEHLKQQIYKMFGMELSQIKQFLLDCEPHLNRMKENCDSNYDDCITFATIIYNSAIYQLINTYNKQHTFYSGQKKKDNLLKMYDEIVEILNLIGKLPMNNECRIHYEKNKSMILYQQERDTPKEGCYIATMVYGDYNGHEVLVLRKFRDCYLRSSITGRRFIKCYYATSPLLVEKLKNKKTINLIIKKSLNFFISILPEKYK